MGDNKNYNREEESFDGYQKQEFSEDGELESVEEEEVAEDYYDGEEYADEPEYEDSANI